MNITLPLGVTWRSPRSELYRALRVEHPEIAELIGELDASEAANEALVESMDDETAETERKLQKANDTFESISTAMNALADKVFEIDEDMAADLQKIIDQVDKAVGEAE